MGRLVNGEWIGDDDLTANSDGAFKRKPSVFRNWVTPDGAPGPSGVGGYKAEAGRYHLYVAWACPWAHRTLIFRALKGLESMIDVSVVHWRMKERGWTFEPGPNVTPDPIFGAEALYEIYQAADPSVTGRSTVPILLDKETRTIVSNESAEIIRMFNAAFDGVGAAPGDYYPEPLRAEIDAVNARIYETFNNGVYRAGFATRQDAYDDAVGALFETMAWLEERLSRQRYLVGDRLTEADWRLFATLFRFDAVYNCHFKCTERRVIDCPNLWSYTRELYQIPGIAATTNLEDTRAHYYGSHASVNPHAIVPRLPHGLDFDAPHDRAEKFPL